MLAARLPSAVIHLGRSITLFRPGRNIAATPIMARRNETAEDKEQRKAAKKAAKEQKRLKRQGLADPGVGQKQCTLCDRPRDLLIRCQVDQSQKWHMVCGKCWMNVSGGEVDGKSSHPHYRYGGLWKNHHKDVSGRNKVPEAARAQGLQGRSSSPAREGAAAGAAGEGGGSRQALRQMLLADAASEDGADEDVSEADSEGEQQAAGEQVAAGAVAG